MGGNLAGTHKNKKRCQKNRVWAFDLGHCTMGNTRAASRLNLVAPTKLERDRERRVQQPQTDPDPALATTKQNETSRACSKANRLSRMMCNYCKWLGNRFGFLAMKK